MFELPGKSQFAKKQTSTATTIASIYCIAWIHHRTETHTCVCILLSWRKTQQRAVPVRSEWMSD